MAEWMYAYSLPVEDHPQGCTCGDCGVIDTTPLCWICGQPMVWTGDEREVELEGGELVVWESVYRCVNPDCDDEGGYE